MNKHPSTTINVHELSKKLSSHPNRCFVNFLLTGLVQDFLADLSFLPPGIHVFKNLLSALKDPKTVATLIQKELDTGYLIGPFLTSPFKASLLVASLLHQVEVKCISLCASLLVVAVVLKFLILNSQCALFPTDVCLFPNFYSCQNLSLHLSGLEDYLETNGLLTNGLTKLLTFLPKVKSTALFEIYPIIIACLLWGNKLHRICSRYYQ